MAASGLGWLQGKLEMQSSDWVEKAACSEIEFSKALKSQPTQYPNFIHLYNPYVPWGGDYNRAVRVILSGFDEFDAVNAQVETIHSQKGLEPPDRFDVAPPALDESTWQDFLKQRGFSLRTVLFFQALTQLVELPDGFTLYHPASDEYMAWYRQLAREQGYAAADWFEQSIPLRLNFCRVFKPYWLMRKERQIGWVYAAHLGDFTRLFEVEIKPEYQGQGMGKLLMQAITVEGYRQGTQHILLQTGERLRPFYEKCGFRECSRNSIIGRIQP
jgi:GNAT superfamily N-acetyltransferase